MSNQLPGPPPHLLALVTGASSGIGYELALELAARGYDILATGRDQTRLEQLRLDCRMRHARQVEILAIDLGTAGGAEELISHWQNRFERLEVLVNNAGFSVHGRFEASSPDREMELVRVQIDTLLRLTKAAMPFMLARKQGYILNVGSVYSFFPVPFQSVYGACKTFLLSFSEALSFETAARGIRVAALCPGSTLTAFRTRHGKKEKTGGMTAETVARIGCQGLFAGKRVIIPGLLNRLLITLATALPRGLVLRVLTRINEYRGVNEA
jgi:uncharacterized protein